MMIKSIVIMCRKNGCSSGPSLKLQAVEMTYSEQITDQNFESVQINDGENPEE